jgi:hypothetical protein
MHMKRINALFDKKEDFHPQVHKFKGLKRQVSRTESVSQMLECLPSKCKVLCSNPGTSKINK